VSLDASDIESIAQRVAQLLDLDLAPARQSHRYVDAATLAELLAIDRSWIYAHADELGAVRLGGVRGRLRFDVQHVSRMLAEARSARAGRRGARRALPDRRRSPHTGVELIPYER
jgi:hypothetical protein